MNRSRVLLVMVIFALAAVSPGCGLINKLRAKDSLNEGVREFNKGRFDLAEEKFERALELSPDLGNAQLFYARAVNARYDQNLTETYGLKTIDAYQTIIENPQSESKSVDQALAFQSRVYEQLAGQVPDRGEEFKRRSREAMLKRAELPGADAKTRAAVYYTIGRAFWQESFDISRAYTKIYQGRVEELPVPPEVQDKMRPLVQQAHEYLSKAIAEQPDYADAWSIRKLTYIQEAKFVTDTERRKELEKSIAEADEKARKFYESQRQQAAQSGS